VCLVIVVNSVQRLVNVSDVVDQKTQVETLSKVDVHMRRGLLPRGDLLERMNHLLDSPGDVELDRWRGLNACVIN